jgi:uncharacterized protein
MVSKWFDAAKKGDTWTLSRLFGWGIEVDATGEYGWTALMHGVWGRHIETVRWLLDRGANPNPKSSLWSAMTLAALCARGWQIEAGRCRAKLEPDGRFLSLLRKAGGRIGLREAILLGDVGMARRIIDRDDSIDINGEAEFGMYDTFLMLAAHVGPVAMVDLLLDKGADIEGTDDIYFTALLRAVGMGRIEIVNRLLERGATAKSSWITDLALNQAARDGHTEVINCLLDRGVVWDKRDPLSRDL